MASESILDGKAIAAELEAEAAAAAARFARERGRPPGLTVVLVGDDPASAVYVRNKQTACERAGIRGRTLALPGDTAAATLGETLDRLNRDDAVDAILIQLPLPGQIAAEPMLEAIDPAKDVDGFHPVNVGRLTTGTHTIAPCTPSGIMELLTRSGVRVAGKRAVVLGRSNIVGKPMALLLLHAHATVTLCHSRTADLPALCREADLLVAAVGRPGLVTPEFVQEGAVVIDVGMNRITDAGWLRDHWPTDSPKHRRLAEKGSVLVGDVVFDAVRAARACRITPVPGGVGPLTIAMLLHNTVALARARAAA